MALTWLKARLQRTALGIFCGMALGAGTLAQTLNLDPIVRVAGDASASGGHVGQYASFKHDSEGGQHVAYYDVINGDLKYAHRASVARPWTIEVIDSAGDVGKYCSLDVGAKNLIVVGADVTPASDGVVFSSGSLVRAAYAGGTLELTADGIVREIASVDLGSNSIRLVNPYAGPALTNATATIRWFQAAIAYQADGGTGTAAKVARPLPDGGWWFDNVFPISGLMPGFFAGYDNSIAISSTGTLSLCYQDRTPVSFQVGKLSFAYYNTAWIFENPDNNMRRGSECKLVFDNNARPVISYRDDVTGQLYSTVREAPGVWISRNLDFSNPPYNALSTAYFPAGDKVLTAYQETPSSASAYVNVRVARGDPFLITNRNWVTQSAANGPAYGGFTSIASGLTTATTRVVFYDAVQKRLMGTQNVTPDSFAWTTPVTLDQSVDVGKFCSSSMLPPALNDLYTAYYDANAGALKLSLWDGVTTSTSFIDGVKVGEALDIGMTSDSVVVAYHNESEGTLHVATWPRGSSPSDPMFTDVVVDASSADVGESVHMAIDQYNRIFLLYYDRANTNLRLAAYHDNTWFTSHLAGETTSSQTAQDVGEFCDIGVNATSTKLAIVYYDGTQKQLIYGFANLPAPTPILNVPFNTFSAGAGPKTGRFCSLAFSPNGNDIHVAFYDETNLRPMYAQLGGSYSIEPIEDSLLDGSGWYTSIAVDPDDLEPAVAFYDFSNGSLKYAKRNGTASWTTEVIDDTTDTGTYPHLRFDPVNGRRYILYHSLGQNELKLAVKLPGITDWYKDLTVGEGYAGTRPRFVVNNVTGLLTLAFYDTLRGDLFATATDTLPSVTRANPAWSGYR